MPRLAWRLQRFCHGAARPYLNCINLTPERQEPPAKVQKRRFKEGKPPLPAYCTVVVAPAYRHTGMRAIGSQAARTIGKNMTLEVICGNCPTIHRAIVKRV